MCSLVVTVTDNAGVEKRFETEVITVTVGREQRHGRARHAASDEPTPTAEPSKGNGAGRAVVIAPLRGGRTYSAGCCGVDCCEYTAKARCPQEQKNQEKDKIGYGKTFRYRRRSGRGQTAS